MAVTVCKREICSGVAKCRLFLWIKHELYTLMHHFFLGELKQQKQLSINP